MKQAFWRDGQEQERRKGDAADRQSPAANQDAEKDQRNHEKRSLRCNRTARDQQIEHGGKQS